MFHVLLALAGDDLHGYAILKDVEMRTEGGRLQWNQLPLHDKDRPTPAQPARAARMP